MKQMRQGQIEYDLPWPRRIHETVDWISAREVRFSDGLVARPLCGTQYLAMMWSPAARKIVKGFGIRESTAWGSLGSSFLGGVSSERKELERSLALTTGEEKALVFSNGWAACFAVSELLARLCDMIVSDQKVHNSVIRGLQAAHANTSVVDLSRYEGGGIGDDYPGKRIGIISNSVDGITGLANRAVFSVEDRKNTIWARDECHSFGVMGARGVASPVDNRADLRIVSFSKALGFVGAAVVGKEDLVDLLAQIASPWIFSTPLPPAIWTINRQLTDLVQRMDNERATVVHLAEEFRRKAGEYGMQTTGSWHISGLHFNPGGDFRAIERALLRSGFYLRVSEAPTTPPNKPCARISFNPWFTLNDVDELVSVLRKTV